MAFVPTIVTMLKMESVFLQPRRKDVNQSIPYLGRKTGVPKIQRKHSVVADIGQEMIYCVPFMIGEVGYWIGDTLDDVGR
jgi:hypothetical protein